MNGVAYDLFDWPKPVAATYGIEFDYNESER
jgi:hypothetical protein